MIPRLKPTLGTSEILAGVHPPRKDDVERFEQSFAELMGQKYALAFSYGRTGLMLLLEALQLKNQEIICPAYTCVVVPHAITYSGNVPVFIDCEQGGFNMDLDLAEQAITKRTGAIIATSLFGYPVNLDRLEEIRKRHPQIHIVQDCAHSFAAKWREKPVQKGGIAAFYGLNISKTLTSVFGGLISTDNEELYRTLATIRRQRVKKPSWRKGFRRLSYLLAAYLVFWRPMYGLINHLERYGILEYFVKYYDKSKIDMPKDFLQGMTGVEARVGMANIKRYDQLIKTRTRASAYYFKKLSRLIKVKETISSNLVSPLQDGYELVLPPRVDGATYSHFVILTRNRDEWLRRGIRKGVQLGWLIEYNIPEMEAYGGHPPEEFPIAARYARTAVNLPVWGGEKIAREVVQLLKQGFFAETPS
jgi:dTDP-4-amino-4,6-dideoxygalactose transaminase